MAWPTGMPLVTITQDVHKLPDGSLPSSYAVCLQLSVPALVYDGRTTLIRRSITLTAEEGSGVISEQVPHLNHPDLSPTPVYYTVTEFADGKRVRNPWQLTPAADDVTIDLDAAAPIAGDPGTPVAVGPPGPAGADGEDGAPGADGLPGDDGAPGADGREVELRTTATHVQWRYLGDATWTDLAALADLGSQTYASLKDVDLTGLTDGDAMVWDATAERWVRVSLSSTYEAKRGADDNYVTDAEKLSLHSHANKTALDEVSGINTGDQDLSGLLPTAAAPELIRDTMGTALVAGDGVTITPDDGADTITIAASGGSGGGITTALYLPGVSGNNVSCPDTAGISLTSDFDVRIKATLTNWDVQVTLWEKMGSSPNRSFQLVKLSSGTLRLYIYPDGSTATMISSTTTVNPSDGDTVWIRVTWDQENGSGQSATEFFWSTDGATWTKIGNTVTNAVQTIYDGPSDLIVGGGTVAWATTALLHNFELRSGIDGTVVASWRGDVPATRYRDPQGNIWTVNGTANAWQEVSA